MGRRKQSNPLKMSASGCFAAEPEVSTTAVKSMTSSPSASEESVPPSAKRSKIDFSIAAQLESASNKPSTSTSTDNGKHHNFQTALKAYETLLSELNNKPNGIKPGPLLRLTKQVDQLASRDGKRNPATESALDLRVKRASTTTTTSQQSQAPAIQSIPVARPSISPLAKKPQPSSSLASDDDSLRKLSSLVGKAGSTMSAHMAAVVKSAPHESKDDNDPCTVFTCLQCFQRFDSMQELTEHMRKTQHLSQQLTSGKLPYCNGNGTTANGSAAPFVPADIKSHHISTKSSTATHTSSSRACSYRYRCTLCGFCNDSSIEEHMRSLHGFKAPSEWIPVVKLIPI